LRLWGRLLFAIGCWQIQLWHLILLHRRLFHFVERRVLVWMTHLLSLVVLQRGKVLAEQIFIFFFEVLQEVIVVHVVFLVHRGDMRAR